MFDYIKRKYIEQRMYHEAFENDASYDEKNPMAKWDSGLWIRYKLFENVLASIPSADVIEPKRGEWLEWIDCEGEVFWKCSACGQASEASAAGILYKFCPFCGADMRVKESE